jgi:hypothetical protein
MTFTGKDWGVNEVVTHLSLEDMEARLSDYTTSRTTYTLEEAGVTFYSSLGAAATGVDATATINAAAALCYTNGWKLESGGGGFLKTTGTVTIPDIDCDLGDMTLRAHLPYPLASETPALRVWNNGDPAAFLNRVRARTQNLPRVLNGNGYPSGSDVRWIGRATLTADPGVGGATLAINAWNSKWPVSGNFRLRIGSEVVIVTAGHGTTSLTMLRGQDGTTAAAHSIGSSADRADSQNDIGVQLINTEGCEVFVPRVADFSIGLDVTGRENAGSAYSTVTIGELTNNMVSLRCGQIEATGWSNSVNYHGGSFNHYDAQTGIRLPGVRHVLMPLIDSGAYNQNGNLWIGSSFEGQGAEYEIESFGSDNAWAFCRWEKSASKPRAWFRAGAVVAASRNIIHQGYGSNQFTTVAPDASIAETNCNNNFVESRELTLRLGTSSISTLNGSYAFRFENGTSIARVGTGVGISLVTVFIPGEAQPRLQLFTDGTIQRGDGTLAPDIQEQRSGVGTVSFQGVNGATRSTVRSRAHASQTAAQALFEGLDSAGTTFICRLLFDGSLELREVTTDPAAPDSTHGNLYFKDDGAGKTMLYRRDSSRIEQLPGVLTGTAAWDPASLTTGSSERKSVTVTGAAVGDPARAGLTTIAATGWDIQAAVIAANTVEVKITNNTGGTVDLASGTVRAVVDKFS